MRHGTPGTHTDPSIHPTHTAHTPRAHRCISAIPHTTPPNPFIHSTSIHLTSHLPILPPLTLITPCLASTERPLRHTHADPSDSIPLLPLLSTSTPSTRQTAQFKPYAIAIHQCARPSTHPEGTPTRRRPCPSPNPLSSRLAAPSADNPATAARHPPHPHARSLRTTARNTAHTPPTRPTRPREDQASQPWTPMVSEIVRGVWRTVFPSAAEADERSGQTACGSSDNAAREHQRVPALRLLCSQHAGQTSSSLPASGLSLARIEDCGTLGLRDSTRT